MTDRTRTTDEAPFDEQAAAQRAPSALSDAPRSEEKGGQIRTPGRTRTDAQNTSRRRFVQLLGTGVLAGGGATGTAVAQETPVVTMGNNYFDPIGLHVEPGTTVRFDLDAGAHSATAYPDRVPTDDAFDSGTISQGSFEYTFEEPGTYDYYCIPHKTVGMVGRIVVGSPGGPAEDSSIPNGEVPSSDVIVQRGSIAYGSDIDGSGTRGGGMMGGGWHDSMHGQTDGTGSWIPFVGTGLGILGLVVGAMVLLLRSNESPVENANSAAVNARGDPALATLEHRYARGEIDEEEFRRRRERLQRADGSRIEG